MDEGHTFPGQQGTRRPRSNRLLFAGFAGAFLLGVGVTAYLFGGSDLGLRELFSVRSDVPAGAVNDGPLASRGRVEAEPETAASGDAMVQEAREAVQRVEQVEEQTGGIDQRVAALEQRLTRLDLQSQAAAGNAARAEGMLIAFASRRALERGQPLGWLEDQLRLRFGESRPNAVQTVIEASAHPVTLDQLLVRLDGLGTELTDAPAGAGLFSRIGHELSQLFSIRTDDTPSPIAERRLERARGNLENGSVERAIAEVRAMPNAAIAEEWLIDAERYAAAQRALEALEAAAVRDPSELRDAAGEQVVQRSPAD